MATEAQTLPGLMVRYKRPTEESPAIRLVLIGISGLFLALVERWFTEL